MLYLLNMASAASIAGRNGLASSMSHSFSHFKYIFSRAGIVLYNVGRFSDENDC